MTGLAAARLGLLMTLFTAGVATAQMRPVASDGQLVAYASSGPCAARMVVTVQAPTQAAFEGDRLQLQRLLAIARAELTDRCPRLSSLVVRSSVGRVEAHHATLSAENGWRLPAPAAVARAPTPSAPAPSPAPAPAGSGLRSWAPAIPAPGRDAYVSPGAAQVDEVAAWRSFNWISEGEGHAALRPIELSASSRRLGATELAALTQFHNWLVRVPGQQGAAAPTWSNWHFAGPNFRTAERQANGRYRYTEGDFQRRGDQLCVPLGGRTRCFHVVELRGRDLAHAVVDASGGRPVFLVAAIAEGDPYGRAEEARIQARRDRFRNEPGRAADMEESERQADAWLRRQEEREELDRLCEFAHPSDRRCWR